MKDKKGAVSNPLPFRSCFGAGCSFIHRLTKCLNVLRLQTLRTCYYIELHRLSFLQAAESTRLDCREMHEDVALA